MSPLERAARALCTLDGNHEDAKIDGKPVWRNYLPGAQAALTSAKMEWRPIKSAPQDGSSVLLFVPEEKNPQRQMVVGAWDADNQRWTAIPALLRLKPSLWLALPPFPQP